MDPMDSLVAGSRWRWSFRFRPFTVLIVDHHLVIGLQIIYRWACCDGISMPAPDEGVFFGWFLSLGRIYVKAGAYTRISMRAV